jgi:hypothetical protein
MTRSTASLIKHKIGDAVERVLTDSGRAPVLLAWLSFSNLSSHYLKA